MTANKKTMYMLLDVQPTASYAEIKAAHRRLSLEVVAGKLGLSREDCDFRLKLLDMALDTLSDAASRAAYDAKLALAAAPGNTSLSYNPVVTSPIVEARAQQMAAEVLDNHKATLAPTSHHQLQLLAVSSTVGASVRSLGAILRIVFGLLVLGFVLKMGQLALAARQPVHRPMQLVKAEEKLIIQQYYKKHGVRPASRAEAEFLEQEERRKEHEQSRAAFDKKRAESEREDFVEESRRIGDRVHDDLAQAERQGQYEEMQRQRELRRQRDLQLERELSRGRDGQAQRQVGAPVDAADE